MNQDEILMPLASLRETKDGLWCPKCRKVISRKLKVEARSIGKKLVQMLSMLLTSQKNTMQELPRNVPCARKVFTFPNLKYRKAILTKCLTVLEDYSTSCYMSEKIKLVFMRKMVGEKGENIFPPYPHTPVNIYEPFLI